MEQLYNAYNQLIKSVDTGFVRYMYGQIRWAGRMLGLVGPRGVGKTTMLLQHIKLHLPVEKTLYVSADSFAPMGQPQKRPHITIKGIYSLKLVLVNFLIIPRGFENAPMCNRIELIIVNGSNVGKTENNQRLSPIRA